MSNGCSFPLLDFKNYHNSDTFNLFDQIIYKIVLQQLSVQFKLISFNGDLK